MEFNSGLKGLKFYVLASGPGSVVGIATGWAVQEWNPVVDEIFRTCPVLPCGSHSLMYNGYRLSSGGKERQVRDANPSPLSSAVVMKE
jgi:hypothetical protein